MSQTIARFGVSLEQNLLEQFDELIRLRQYNNRSEAFRDLIRKELVAQEWSDPKAEVIGIITLIYDHHVRQLANRLTELQHEFTEKILVATHLHLDHHNCLETIIARGEAGKIAQLVERFRSESGVKHVTLSSTTTGVSL